MGAAEWSGQRITGTHETGTTAHSMHATPCCGWRRAPPRVSVSGTSADTRRGERGERKEHVGGYGRSTHTTSHSLGTGGWCPLRKNRGDWRRLHGCARGSSSPVVRRLGSPSTTASCSLKTLGNCGRFQDPSAQRKYPDSCLVSHLI